MGGGACTAASVRQCRTIWSKTSLLLLLDHLSRAVSAAAPIASPRLSKMMMAKTSLAPSSVVYSRSVRPKGTEVAGRKRHLALWGHATAFEGEEGGDVSFEAAATADQADLPLEKRADGGEGRRLRPRGAEDNFPFGPSAVSSERA